MVATQQSVLRTEVENGRKMHFLQENLQILYSSGKG